MAWILFFNSTFFSYNLLTIKLNLTIKSYILFFFLIIIYFIYLFLAVPGLCFCARARPPVAASGGHPSSRCAGLPLSQPPLPRSTQAPDAQAQQPWPTGPAAPRHAGSPQTRARTRVPCIGRQTPNHCATREALNSTF